MGLEGTHREAHVTAAEDYGEHLLRGRIGVRVRVRVGVRVRARVRPRRAPG